MEGFGVTNETKSQNQVNYDKGGFKKATLVEVKTAEVGKDEANKYKVLSFKFIDADGIKTFTHSEFLIDPTDTDYAKKLNGMNVRIKHMYEAFLPFPATGVGVGATSFEDFFARVATAFNTGGTEGKPIFKDEKGSNKLVWIKLGYYRKKDPTQIGFPLSPNFIEGIKDAQGAAAPKTLTTNTKYDNYDQPKVGGASGGTMGSPGAIHTGSNDNEF